MTEHTFENDGSGYCRHPLDESTACGKDEAWHYQIISMCGQGPASGTPGTECGESSEDGKCPKCGSASPTLHAQGGADDDTAATARRRHIKPCDEGAGLMIRRNHICVCGNCDDEDVDSMSIALPPCSASCGKTMRVTTIISEDVERQPEPEDYAEDYRYDER